MLHVSAAAIKAVVFCLFTIFTSAPFSASTLVTFFTLVVRSCEHQYCRSLPLPFILVEATVKQEANDFLASTPHGAMEQRLAICIQYICSCIAAEQIDRDTFVSTCCRIHDRSTADCVLLFDGCPNSRNNFTIRQVPPGSVARVPQLPMLRERVEGARSLHSPWPQ